MRKWSMTIVAVLASGIVSCGGASGEPTPTSPSGPGQNPGGGTPSGTPTVVTISGQYFTPTEVRVSIGVTVSWNWDDCSNGGYGGECATHSVTFDDGSLSSEVQSQGAFSRTFSSRGTFAYHCRVHGAMKGQVVVQ